MEYRCEHRLLILRDFLSIGNDRFIALDASITRDMDAGSVGLGSPPEIIGPDDRRCTMIKGRYFKL